MGYCTEKWIACSTAALFLLLFSSNGNAAGESLSSIAGYSLGQDCNGPEFKKESEKLLNPKDALDYVQVERKSLKKELEGNYKLRVDCGIENNKVYYVALTSDNPQDIETLKQTLREKMARQPDKKEDNGLEPMNILGNKMDGMKMANETWSISESSIANAFTHIIVPYGATSMSDYKWSGGMSLLIKGTPEAEWGLVKRKGTSSAKEQKKERIRNLLN